MAFVISSSSGICLSHAVFFDKVVCVLPVTFGGVLSVI